MHTIPLSYSSLLEIHHDLFGAWSFVWHQMSGAPGLSRRWHNRLTSISYHLLAVEDFNSSDIAIRHCIFFLLVLLGRLETCWSNLCPSPVTSDLEFAYLTLVGMHSDRGARILLRRELAPHISVLNRTVGRSIRLATATEPKHSAPFFWCQDYAVLHMASFFNLDLRAKWLRTTLHHIDAVMSDPSIPIPSEEWRRISGRLGAVAVTVRSPTTPLRPRSQAILDSIFGRAGRAARGMRGRGLGRGRGGLACSPSTRLAATPAVPEASPYKLDMSAFPDRSPTEILLEALPFLQPM
ncbi:hypothetical protein BJ165DRAFT_1526412 [Panaeolus papilionaceus]|nr:hypothetical protein BJ165DRAFT_1526412 [Panaeolus papilionaceus]